MPHIIAIENSEAQRRQLSEKIRELEKKGWALNGKYEAQNFGSWLKLFENAITPGLFAAREILVIENADNLGVFPDELSELADKNENADCIIILVFNSDTKNLNTIKKSITIIKPEAQIPPWKRKTWLLELAKNEKISLAPDAAELLAESIESQEELRSEIHKLALYSDSIKINDVENLSFDEGGRALLIFLDGVCAGNAADVARALKYLRNEPLLPVLAAITNRLRPAMIFSFFSGSYSDMALKATGSDPAKKNYALNKAKNALKIFGAAKIRKFIAGAVRISFLEKTNRAEGWNGFELILWELILNLPRLKSRGSK